VAELAAHIAGPRADAGRPLPDLIVPAPPDPRALLRNLDALSDSEMDALLAAMLTEEEELQP